MTTPELAAAILLLLATPGPTNTLLFVAGGERGARALALVPAEVAGYLATVLPLGLAGAALVQAVPGLHAALALGAGLWVAWLAHALWRPQARAGGGRVTAGRVVLTTLLNPKALIFGLVLLPAGGAGAMAGHAALFAACVAGVGAAWTLGGALVARGGAAPARLTLVRRGAAVWLAVVAAGLLARGAGVA
jgi:threonine/homoserine/homoserine lactone efflux protein